MKSMVKYKIEITQDQFEKDGRNFEQSVVVESFLDRKLISRKRYGYMDANEVYQSIKSSSQVNLNNCYITNFSIADYKKKNGLDELAEVVVNEFSAINAFFDCDLKTDFSYLQFNKEANFSYATFSHGNVSFYKSRFKQGVSFSHVNFGNGEILFQYASFGQGDINFDNTIFNGHFLSFVNADFGDGNVDFSSANFGKSKVKFHYAKFGEGEKNFKKAKFFEGTLDCRRVEFGKGKIDFRRAVFGDGYVTFDEAEITSGKITFKSARFGNSDLSFKLVNFGSGDVIFENVNFGSGFVSFANSISKRLSFRESRLDVYLDLRVKSCESIDLSYTILRDIIDIKPNEHDVKVETMYLSGMRNLGRIMLDWKKNDVHALIKNQPDTSLREKSEQFNILKEDFHMNGQYEDEDRAYIQFKRFEQRADIKDTLSKGGISSFFNMLYYLFRWVVFDKMGLYATSPLRVLLSMIVVYVLFSLSYLILPYISASDIVLSVDATDALSHVQKSFYHSAITFLTIGYGDYFPTGYSRGFSIVEGWMGLFLMSYFTVAFVRKILR